MNSQSKLQSCQYDQKPSGKSQSCNGNILTSTFPNIPDHSQSVSFPKKSTTDISMLNRSNLMKTVEAIAAIATYCLASISATILNRHVLSDLQFGMNALLLIFEWFIAIIFLLILRSVGVLRFRILRRDEIIKWIPVSLGVATMTYSGTKCLEHCAISIVTIFKNTSILLVAFGDFFFFKKKIAILTYFSFFLIILSSFLGIVGDTRFNTVGLIWLLINCLTTAMYVLCLKGTLKVVKFKDFDTVFNNSLMSIPFMFVISICFDAWNRFLDYETNPFMVGEWPTILSVLGCTLSTFMTAIGIAWVVRITSPTTYSMTAALNKLPVSLGGILFLKSERSVSTMNIVGIGLGFISGLVYSFSMVRQSKRNSRAKEKLASSMLLSTEIPIQPPVIEPSSDFFTSSGEPSLPIVKNTDDLEDGSLNKTDINNGRFNLDG